MSLSGFSTTVSALQSFVVRQDVTANNTANVLSAGFKRSRALNQDVRPSGTRISEISPDFRQGGLETATNAFDLAIEGEGFFKVQGPGDAARYVRAGVFGLDSNRELVTPQGLRLSPPVQIPFNASGFAVRADGTVVARLPDGTEQNAGQITLTRFPNPAGLLQEGGGVYAAFTTAGVPQDGAPGSGAFGALVSGTLEGSNVDLAEETVDAIRNLGAFKINAKVIRVRDEMLGTLLDIRR